MESSPSSSPRGSYRYVNNGGNSSPRIVNAKKWPSAKDLTDKLNKEKNNEHNFIHKLSRHLKSRCDVHSFIILTVFVALTAMIYSLCTMPSAPHLNEGLWDRKICENKFSRIAIIGAGPAGLFSAQKLLKNNFSQITVFERRNRVGGNAETLIIDNQAYDCSTTMIGKIPQSIDSPFNAVIDMFTRYGEGWTDVPPVKVVDLTSGDVLPGMNWLLGNNPMDLIGNLSRGYDLLKQMGRPENHARGIGATSTIGVLPGETLSDWAKRNQLELFARLIVSMIDLFQAGPATNMSAQYALWEAEAAVPATLKAILQTLRKRGGIRLEDMPNMHFSPEFMKLGLDLTAAAYMAPIKGYQHFFETLVQKEGINVMLNMDITHTIRERENGTGSPVWILETADHHRHGPFDVLIISSTDMSALSYLPSTAPIAPYFHHIRRGHPVRSIFFRAEVLPSNISAETPNIATLSNNNFIVVEPVLSEIGNPEYAEHPYSIWRRYPTSNVYQAFSYARLVDKKHPTSSTHHDDDEDTEYAYKVLRRDIAKFGGNVTEIITSRVYHWPSAVSTEALANDNWLRGVTAQPAGHQDASDPEGWGREQGLGGLFLLGEAISGWTVPAALRYVDAVMPTYFPAQP